MDGMMRALAKWIGPLKRRVLLTVGRGVLRLIDDDGGVQRVQMTALDGETLDRVERFAEYGFTSRPHPEAEAVLIAVGGDRAHALVVAVEDRRYRLRGLKTGEVAVYDDLGQIIKLARDGIEIETRADVTVTAPRVEIAAQEIDLGGGAEAGVARIGDMVEVGAGSSAGRWPIVSGSGKVKAG